jgi:hypothetical protein
MGRDLVICTSINSSCAICRKFEGKVFSISGQSKKFPPLYTGPNAPFAKGYNIIHPNCRHEFLPFIDELYTEKELAELEKKSNRFVNYTGKEKIFASYREQQSKLRQYREEKIEYDEMKAEFGKDMPYETLGGFRRAKRADSEEYKQAHKMLAVSQKKAEIRQGGYNLTVDAGKQGKHIIGHNNFNATKSIVTLTEIEIQEMVNKTAGTGELVYTKSNDRFANKEIVMYDRVIGQIRDGDKMVETNMAKIHYAKDGVHIVPYLKRSK